MVLDLTNVVKLKKNQKIVKSNGDASICQFTTKWLANVNIKIKIKP